MIVRISDNIVSSLGFTTGENYRAVLSGQSGIRRYEAATMHVQEPFYASLINREELNHRFACLPVPAGHYTPLEKAAILSVSKAQEEAGIDLDDPRILFVFSSTKGNIGLLNGKMQTLDSEPLYLWHTARRIASCFHHPNEPLVVSNACISGAAAQIAALRALQSGRYDYAVVTGSDELSPFIVSGFQSLKALSDAVCRPFDAARTGLNLGEAAASLIYKREDFPADGVALLGGTIRNDANHISGPSRTGEGSFRALQAVMQGADTNDIAFINAHGTATPYNDRMEAVAISRAGLETIPVNSLKGYFGHTLGAAGIVESIISMHALAEKTLLPTYGLEEKEEQCRLDIIQQVGYTEKTACIKMLSGFGGVNAALLFQTVTHTSIP